MDRWILILETMEDLQPEEEEEEEADDDDEHDMFGMQDVIRVQFPDGTVRIIPRSLFEHQQALQAAGRSDEDEEEEEDEDDVNMESRHPQ